MTSDAGFSECRTWRYWLTRSWAEGGRTLMVIGLNPSTADESVDDPTIRRCIGYAKAWGFSQLAMLNLFAYRATDPRHMKAATNPVGRENDQTLLWWANKAEMILGAWGTHGVHQSRAAHVYQILYDHPIHCLGITKDGQPKHPLYLRADARPEILTGHTFELV